MDMESLSFGRIYGARGAGEGGRGLCVRASRATTSIEPARCAVNDDGQHALL